MSEAKPVCPLLDKITLVEMIGSRNGVSCFIAKKTDTEETYLYKHISIPESQTKVEALLLAGAYPDEAAAGVYYKRCAKEIGQELDRFAAMSKDGTVLSPGLYQIMQKEAGCGYDIHILEPMRLSLAKYLSGKTFTHLNAINLGIDICQALTVIRQAGYLYLDLKPENIFVVQDMHFKIGDLGLAPLEDLQFSSMPEKYLSCYSAPELDDILASLNTTVDTYALGMLLYRIYNGNQGPFDGDGISRSAAEKRRMKGEAIPAPLFADYELANLLQKACAPSPAQRFETPEAFMQALISYMQRNQISDTAIAPPIIADSEPIPAHLQDEDSELSQAAAPTQSPEPEPEPEEPVPEREDTEDAAVMQPTEALPPTEPEAEQAPEDEVPSPEQDKPAEPDEAPAPEPLDASAEEADPKLTDDLSKLLADASSILEGSRPQQEETQEGIPSDMPTASSNEEPATAEPEAETSESAEAVPSEALPETEASEERAEAPEEPAKKQKKAKKAKEPKESKKQKKEQQLKEMLPPMEPEADTEPPRRKKKIWIPIVCVLLVLALAAGGLYYYYRQNYLIHISSLDITAHTTDTVSISAVTERNDPSLTAYCTDTYGNRFSADFKDGAAVITGLTPGTQYVITVGPKGRHEVTGTTTLDVVTATATEITQFTATQGAAPETVLLEFVVSGPESENWRVVCSAEGYQSQTIPFTGHKVEIQGLEVGITYTFTLQPEDGYFVTGTDTVTHTPAEPTTADNLKVTAYGDGSMTVGWETPSGDGRTWTVSCTDNAQYNETQQVSSPSAVFTGIDAASAYTVTVTAPGLGEPAQLEVSSNPVTLENLTLTRSDDGHVAIGWDAPGNAPADGWVVQLRYGDSALLSDSQKTEDTQYVLTSCVPGSTLAVSITTVTPVTLVGNTDASLDIPEAGAFTGFQLSEGSVSLKLFKEPAKSNWGKADVGEFVTAFGVNSGIAYDLKLPDGYKLDTADTTAVDLLWVIRDADGALLAFSNQSTTWSNLWNGSDSLGTIDWTPAAAGVYKVECYLNNGLLTSSEITAS